jgi:frataxin
MSDADFEARAARALRALVDASDAAGLDVEQVEGVVTIETDDGGQYVVNRHGPNRQIWLSSPVSGAWHFDWRDGRWASTRGDQQLDSLLGRELGIEIALG